jgi:hypothetical protein
MAYEQVGMLFGALFCFGLGGLLLGYSLYSRIRGERVTGTIIGIHENKGKYNAVYRYTLASGETHESISSIGSGLKGKETGRTVPLIITPNDPNNSSEANMYVLEGIGVVLTGMGLVFFKIALKMPVTPMTVVMAIALSGYFAFKFKKHIIPKGQRLSLAAWKAQHLTKDIDPAAVTTVEKIQQTPEYKKMAALSKTQSRIAIPILLVLGCGLLIGSYTLSEKQQALEKNGLHSMGMVTRLESSSGSDSTTYHAVVAFSPNKLGLIEFKDSLGSNPPAYRNGEQVKVLYLKDNPQKSAVIDRGLWNWLVPSLLGIGGALCLAGFVSLIKKLQEE